LDESALLQAILDDPDDLDTRRVYGDVLSARGEARGELIQIQCELAELPTGDARRGRLRLRADELIAMHRARWIEPFAKQISSCEFRRGMVEVVRAKPNRLFNEDDRLFVREPVVELAVTRLTHQAVGPFAELPLEGVRKLRVHQSALGATATTLFAAPTLESLRALDLDRAGIDDQGLVGLRDSRLAGQLDELVLSNNQITGLAIAELAGDTRFDRLTTLALAHQLPRLVEGAGPLAVFAAKLALPALTALDLSNNQLGNDELAALVASRAFRALRTLRLADNRVRGAAISALATMSRLEVLAAEDNPLGPACGAAIAEIAWPLLRELRLGHTRRLGQGGSQLGDDGAVALAKARLPALVALDVRGHEIGARGMRAFAQAGWALEELDLSGNKIGSEGAVALAGARFAPSLRVLRVARCQLGNHGLATLAAAAWPRLEVLDLAGERLDHEGFSALLAANLPRLAELDLSGTRPSRNVERAFAKRLGAGLRT
jgi:uncharacterized protein (TIGR02996 family)